MAMLKGLTSAALLKILGNGADRDRIAAAKLVVLMQKLEKESYLELKRQTAGPEKANVAVFADPAFLGRAMAHAAEFRAKLGRSVPVEAQIVE